MRTPRPPGPSRDRETTDVSVGRETTPMGRSESHRYHEPSEHDHVHGAGCGHRAVPHEDHLDYLHDGHWHAPHEGHYDEHIDLDG
jgi:hypothetical protein